jgi:hypothetical protein
MEIPELPVWVQAEVWEEVEAWAVVVVEAWAVVAAGVWAAVAVEVWVAAVAWVAVAAAWAGVRSIFYLVLEPKPCVWMKSCPDARRRKICNASDGRLCEHALL